MKIAGTLLAGLSAAAVIALPTAGHAAAGASVQVSGETIVYTAGDGERNAVTVFSGSGEITSLSGRINAGTGDDAYFAGRALGATGITFSGGEGEDFVVHGSTAVRASLDGVADDGRQATGDKDNILTDVEHITGSSQGDVLAGSGARNRIEGGPGADELYGLGGADTILAKDSTTTRDPVPAHAYAGSLCVPRDNPVIMGFGQEAIATLDDPVDPEFAREFQLGTTHRPLPPALLELFAGESLKVPARVWRAAYQGLLDSDTFSALTGVTAPTLLVWGDADAFATRAEQDRLLDAMPNARLLVYPGTGHAVHWEEPGRFAGDLAAFAHQVAEGAAAGRHDAPATPGRP